MSQCQKVEHACKYTAALVYFYGETEYNSCPLECGLALVTAQSADNLQGLVRKNHAEDSSRCWNHHHSMGRNPGREEGLPGESPYLSLWSMTSIIRVSTEVVALAKPPRQMPWLTAESDPHRTLLIIPFLISGFCRLKTAHFGGSWSCLLD